MDWNGHHHLRPFVPQSADDTCFNFLCNYNYDQFPGIERRQVTLHQAAQHLAIPATITMDKNMTNNSSYGCSSRFQMEKKKRLTSDQLESLENSFQEEIKLDPDRKMKLAKELGMQPRQIAVWFQNRRARWKAKQLEHLYDALKHEFDVVSREKQKLQDEVLALRAILKGQCLAKKQVVSTEISGGEETTTVESISIPNSSNVDATTTTGVSRSSNYHQREGSSSSSYVFNVNDEYNNALLMHPPLPYWNCLPSS